MKHALLRWISVVLLAALVSQLLPVSAAEPTAKIGDTLFLTLSEAAEHAQSGDVIELLTDCTITNTVELPAGITLDGRDYRLTLNTKACLQASGDLTLCNLRILMNRSASSGTSFLLEGEHAQYELNNLVIQCPAVSRAPRSTDLLTFSATDSTLALNNCQLLSEVNNSIGILLTKNCSGSTISLSQTDIRIEAQSSASFNGWAISSESTDAVVLTAEDSVLQAPSCAISVGGNQRGIQVSLTDCQLYAVNPLHINGLGGTYDLFDCVLSDQLTDTNGLSGLLFVGFVAQDNRISIDQSRLESGSNAASPCVFSIQNVENEISMGDHTTISIESDTLDLVHVGLEMPAQTPVGADQSVDLSAFPIVWHGTDNTLRNASTELSRAAPLWQSGDTITLHGTIRGALDLQVPVTILGENASFSGSLSIRASGTVIHELDLSDSTIDCVPDCDLSQNYWGEITPPANTITSPLYTDSDLSDLMYAQVPDNQVAQEIDHFITQVEEMLSSTGGTLETFNPLTDSDGLDADTLRSLCTRLRESTSAAQRESILSATPAQKALLDRAWYVYWCGVGYNASDSQVTISPQLNPPADDMFRAAMTQNAAANQPVQGLSVDGTQFDSTTPIFVHSTLTDWQTSAVGHVQSLTFQTELRTDQGTVVPGSGTYRLPLPTQDIQTVSATINQSQVTLPAELSPEGYAYVTLSELGTIQLTLPQPEEPDTPDDPNPDPDDPPQPTDPEQPLYTITLRGGTHGTLRLRTPSECAADEVVKITVLPDDGYLLDTVDILDTRGDEVDYSLSGDILRFTMPASDVRVTARFIPEPVEYPTELAPEPSVPMTDLPSGIWYEDAVMQMIEQGFMSPLLTGQFCPDLAASRGDLIVALYRMAGTPSAYATAFTDIPPDSAYYDASIWGRVTSIAIGEPDGRFRPYDTVTREECIALLYRFSGCPPVTQTTLPFSDFSSVSDWARPAMCWAYTSGILYGNAEGTCTPLAPITRAEAAALLTRLWQAN